MLKIIFSFLVIFLLVTNVSADNKTDQSVKNVYEEWCHAIGTAKGHADVMTKFYAPDAVLLATFSKHILINHDGGLNKYFSNLTSNPNIQCKTNQLITKNYGNVAINTGFYTFTYDTANGKQKIVPARFTFVYENLHHQWLIVNHHSSQVP